MTEKRKQELRRLLEEARERLEVHPLPVDVYRRYLQERWKCFGLDRFSPFWIQPTLDIGSDTTKSRLLEFIREELTQFLGVNGDSISVATYFIEHHTTNRSRLNRVDGLLRTIDVDFILTRLLDIALVRGVEQAVSVFDICSRPEGSSCIFQRISVVKGIGLKTDIEVCKGIRLLPIPDSGISDRVLDYFPSFPRTAFRYAFPNFSKQTLLAIDCPGVSMFHKPGPNQEFPQELPVGELPFRLEGYDVRNRDSREVESFRESFSRALSLSVDFPVEIPRGGFFPTGNGDSHVQNGTFSIRTICEGLFMAEDQTFSPRHVSAISLIPANRPRVFARANEAHVEQAKCLYDRLVNFDSKDRGKLLIAINRWIKSKASGSEADKIIDVGIALEALYVTGRADIRRKLCYRAPRYLGEEVAPLKTLTEEFEVIYDYRCDVVHNKVPGYVPVTELVTRAQDLCLRSILKIIKNRTFPDWSTVR